MRGLLTSLYQKGFSFYYIFIMELTLILTQSLMQTESFNSCQRHWWRCLFIFTPTSASVAVSPYLANFCENVETFDAGCKFC